MGGVSETAYRRGLCKICTIKILVTKYSIEILELYERRVNEIIHRMEIYHLTEPVLILDFCGHAPFPSYGRPPTERGGASLIKTDGYLASNRAPSLVTTFSSRKKLYKKLWFS
jgi:hypothetical protein